MASAILETPSSVSPAARPGSGSGAGPRQVLTRQDDPRETEFDQLAQPFLAVSHGPHLTGETQLPVHHQR